MKKLLDAINKGDLDTVKRLIGKYPNLLNCRSENLRKRDEGQSPLRVAIKNCMYEIVQFLAENGANVNDYTSNDDMYISHQAIYTVIRRTIPTKYVGSYEDAIKILKLLIDNHLNINIENARGNCFIEGLALSRGIIHNDLYSFDFPNKLKYMDWNNEFDIQVTYSQFKEVFSLLLEHGVNTDIPNYWLQMDNGMSEAIIKWKSNILKLCKEDM